jgi:hypothetical protein
MTSSRSIGLFAVVVACGCLVPSGQVRSDDGPAKAAQAAGTENGLTDASLEAMLRGMGYDPKITKSSSGKRTYYRLILSEDTFNFVFDMSLDVERTRVSFSAPLPVVNDKDGVAAERLWKLLEVNDDILPASFSYDKGNKRLYLNMAIDNRGITTAVLRKEITQFTRLIERTCPHWKEIQPAVAPATPPATPPVIAPVIPPATPPAAVPGN